MLREVTEYSEHEPRVFRARFPSTSRLSVHDDAASNIASPLLPSLPFLGVKMRSDGRCRLDCGFLAFGCSSPFPALLDQRDGPCYDPHPECDAHAVDVAEISFP